ncbi:MAG: restriction endonuclease subunit S [Candidatus Peribacteraceae bacterium]|nr:restriction endonuclease subunit S [Candidatus Peribacteraceae bacterium]
MKAISYKLIDICEMHSGGTPRRGESKYYGGDILWAKIGDLERADDEFVIDTEEKITMSGLEAIRNRMFPKNAVLLAMYGSVGKVAIAGRELSTNQAILGMIPNPDILYYRFLAYWLNSKKNQLIHEARGVALQNISKSIVAKQAISLPSLDEQKHIVFILDQADALRRKRKEAIRLLDEYVQSVFFEMFGDPVTNPKGWEVMAGRDYCKQICVGVVIKPASYYVEKGVIALRSLNIKKNYIDLDNVVYFSEAAHKGAVSKSTLRSRDVVIVRTGVTGTAAVIPQELDGINCIDLIIAKPNTSIINPYYLSYLFNSERVKQLVSSKEVGGIQKHFNIGAIKKLAIPIPPLELQNQFERVHSASLSTNIIMGRQDTKFDELFNVLMQKAFAGVGVN